MDPLLSPPFALPPTISLQEVSAQAESAMAMLQRIRSNMLAPRASKNEPVFGADELAEICGLPGRASVAHYMKERPDLPSGTLSESGRKRLFKLSEARQWTKAFRKDRHRPAGAEAITITVANFKGGTTKTTTTMSLAQGLSIRGHKVLVIDTDPQASLTTLFGILPDMEVEDRETILALVDRTHDSVKPLIRKTYWDGLDLVPASTSLFSAEFMLPSKQQSVPGYEFWNVLDMGIDEVRSEYDVIILDSPPALSYVTINALFAANGLIMPLPPETLDYASACQFWELFAQLTREILEKRGSVKEFEFQDILLTKVSKSMTTDLVRQWISATYGSKVLPLEIPRTAAATLKATEFGTVYDASADDLKDRTYKRAREAYDLFVEHIEGQVFTAWQRQISK